MNPRVSEISASLIREMHARKRATSIDLGLGEPTLSPNPVHFERAMRHVAKHGVKYSPNAGDPDLRHAIAQQYRYPKMDAAENVCVTVGSQEAMYVALKTLLDPSRDELVVVEPAFPSCRASRSAISSAISLSTSSSATATDFGPSRTRRKRPVLT